MLSSWKENQKLLYNITFCFNFLQAKEAKRLKEFLEDYDDDRDDPKYYRYVAFCCLDS